MEMPIDSAEYQPTRNTTTPAQPLSPKIESLLAQLVRQTELLQRNPYDPQHWLDRARTLTTLDYPELAYGDAWKAEHCCRTLFEEHHRRKGAGLGVHRGFWMHRDGEALLEEVESSIEGLTGLLRAAVVVQEANSVKVEGDDMVDFVSRPYPWLAGRHRARSDALLLQVNADLRSTQPVNAQGQPYCMVRRGAYASPTTGDDEAFGVFANVPIAAGATIVRDKSTVWGCLRGRAKQRRKESSVADDPGIDLRWIQDVERDRADRILLRVRCLLQCIKEGAVHPLDHWITARLKPTYHNAERLAIFRNADIVIVNTILLQLGVDILANHNFDTWILLTIDARLDNNCCSRPDSCSLNSLFALFNHSCEPNVSWECQQDCRTVHMAAIRQIEEGEQLFIRYDSYLSDKPVQQRQHVLRRWIDGDCSCTRCVREIQSRGVVDEVSSLATAPWNTGVATLPEESSMA